MYNLTVERAHTFFVGDKHFLVHNTCQGLTDDEFAKAESLLKDAVIEYNKYLPEELLSRTTDGYEVYRSLALTKDKSGNLIKIISGDSKMDRFRAKNGFLPNLSSKAKNIFKGLLNRQGEFHAEVQGAVHAIYDKQVWAVTPYNMCNRNGRGCLIAFQEFSGRLNIRLIVADQNVIHVFDKGEYTFRSR